MAVMMEQTATRVRHVAQGKTVEQGIVVLLGRIVVRISMGEWR